MSKQEFLNELWKGLSGLPQEDIERSIDFYSEMIDDRIEEGLTEAQATAAIGSVKDIVSQILSETSPNRAVKVKPNRTLKAWEVILLILGPPIWLPLLMAAVIVLMAFYIVIWSLVITMYAVDISLVVGGITGIFASVMYILRGNFVVCVLFAGASLICLGLSILLFFGFNQITKGILFVSKTIVLQIKSWIVRKEKVL